MCVIYKTLMYYYTFTQFQNKNRSALTWYQLLRILIFSSKCLICFGFYLRCQNAFSTKIENYKLHGLRLTKYGLYVVSKFHLEFTYHVQTIKRSTENHDILMTVLHKWKIMNYNHEKLDFISLIVSKKKPDVIIL